MKLLVLTLLSLHFLPLTETASKVNGEELDLVNYLFNKSRYDERILPSVGQNGPLNVIVGLTIYRIEDLVEKSQELVTDAVLHLTWNDPHLVWNQSGFGGIKDIVVNPRRIWLPDVVLYNSAGSNFQARRLGLVRATVHYDGNVSLNSPNVLRTICKADLEDYPMDEQKCDMVFGSSGHDAGQISVKSTHFDLSRYIINGQWEISGTTFEQKLNSDSENAYYNVTFTLKLRRRVLYYAIYLIIPGTLIALLAAIIFVLPQDCSERITVGMAILVALSFFFLLVSETMPPSARVSIVGGYYEITMIQMTISFFLNVLVLRFHHMTEEKVPEWVKKYILNYGARFLRMTFRARNNQQLQSMKRRKFLLLRKKRLGTIVEQKKKQKFPAESLADDKVIADVFETQIKMAARDEEWKKAAEVLNNYSLILHVLAVLLTFGLVFFEALLLSNKL